MNKRVVVALTLLSCIFSAHAVKTKKSHLDPKTVAVRSPLVLTSAIAQTTTTVQTQEKSQTTPTPTVSSNVSPDKLQATHERGGIDLSSVKPESKQYNVSYNIGVVSDYRFRGIAQTSYKPAVQGGLELNLDNGFYTGLWMSNERWVRGFNGASQSAIEIDIYGGFKFHLNPNWDLDVGAISYRYPNSNSGALGTRGYQEWEDVNTNEIYAQISYKGTNLKINHATGQLFGTIRSQGATYVDLNKTFDLPQGYSLTAHVGRQMVPWRNEASYTDQAITLTKDLGKGWSASVMGTITNTQQGGFYTNYPEWDGKFVGKSAVVLGIKRCF
jgi:uncharacterized protein (TIGR02001 family)